MWGLSFFRARPRWPGWFKKQHASLGKNTEKQSPVRVTGKNTSFFGHDHRIFDRWSQMVPEYINRFTAARKCEKQSKKAHWAGMFV